MSTKQFDKKKSKDFADRMVEIMNNGALALMISIGHRTGLFDTMHNMSPATSGEIADQAGLNERYVREWLGAMTVGKIVECNPSGPRFSLPLEHASRLTREAKQNNLALFAQYIPLLGINEDKIIECFRKGGGIPYSEYKRFHQVKAEDCAQMVVPAIIDKILPVIPGIIESLQRGIEVLDVGCGSGQILNHMANYFPNSRFVGYDFSEEAITTGKNDAEKQSLTNINFEIKDLTTFEFETKYDFITAFDAIHDQPNPEKVLARISGSLKPNGIFLMQEIAASSDVWKNSNHFIGPMLYTISCLHCMSVSLSQNGPGLGTMWGEEKTLVMLRKVGFNSIRVEKLPHDFQYTYYIMSRI